MLASATRWLAVAACLGGCFYGWEDGQETSAGASSGGASSVSSGGNAPGGGGGSSGDGGNQPCSAHADCPSEAYCKRTCDAPGVCTERSPTCALVTDVAEVVCDCSEQPIPSICFAERWEKPTGVCPAMPAGKIQCGAATCTFDPDSNPPSKEHCVAWLDGSKGLQLECLPYSSADTADCIQGSSDFQCMPGCWTMPRGVSPDSCACVVYNEVALVNCIP